MSSLEIGIITTTRLKVGPGHLADQLAIEPGENFPAVFSTPWLLAQLERTAAKAMHPVLEEGQISVGARASLEHVAPTPPGAEVTAYARFLGIEGPLYLFDVWAEDTAGRIGGGTHARAIAPKIAVEKRAHKRVTALVA